MKDMGHTKLCRASLGTAGAAPGVGGAVGDNGPVLLVSYHVSELPNP